METVRSLGRGFIIRPLAYVELSEKILDAVSACIQIAHIKASATEAAEIGEADKTFKKKCSQVALICKKRLFPPNVCEWGNYSHDMEPRGFNGLRFRLMLGKSSVIFAHFEKFRLDFWLGADMKPK